MPGDVKAIANYFIGRSKEANREITHLKLQKLVYIAHGWHLAVAGEPLISNRIEAWPYGPVVPELYYSLRQYGASPIAEPFRYAALSQPNGVREFSWDRCSFTDQRKTKQVLEYVWEYYGSAHATQLSALTHQPGSPWSVVRAPISPLVDIRPEIPNELIREHYVGLWRERAAKNG